MNRSCNAAVFVGTGKPFELRAFPLPEPGESEALIRIECCTVCGSDLHTITGARTEPTPSILGHEILGIVESLGSPAPTDVAGVPLTIGDRVTWSTAISCGACDRCTGGLPQKCRTLAKYGHAVAEGRQALSGGMAEYLLLRKGSATVRVPKELAAEIICPVNCATATVTAALRRGDGVRGKRVLIVGAGMLGLTAAALCKTLEAETVSVADIDARRLQRALRFGADRLVELQAGTQKSDSIGAFDLVLELSGSPDAVELAIAQADIGACVVLVGSVMKLRAVPLDPESVVRRCLSIYGVHNYAPLDLQTAVDFLTKYGTSYPFAELVESSFTLSQTNEAVAWAVQNRPVRVAIRP